MNDLLDRAKKAARHADNELLKSEATIIRELAAENLTLRQALKDIAKMGQVCGEFEVCGHLPCRDSAGACLLAMNVLTELGVRTPGQD